MTDSPATPTGDRSRPRILSGVQPSGRLHLGNYFGAIKQHIEMQEVGECYYFIANYHSLTTLRDRQTLLDNTHDVAVTYLALGLDPGRTVFYRQSDVPEVTELTWLLATVTGMGLLERAHSYKEKVARGITPGAGLFIYPVLMAADILAPQSDLVPVGKDQEQHVEMTRNMAAAFNSAFCDEKSGREPVFRIPESRFSVTPRVPGTTYDKGAVLMVNCELAPRTTDGKVLEADQYVAQFRALIETLLKEHDAAAVSTTEQLEALVAKAHATACPGAQVMSRTLRTTAQMPAGEYHAIPKPESLGLEFGVPLDRTLFFTVDGKRQAAKMSKSYGNTIEIFAEGKPLKKAVNSGIETSGAALEDAIDVADDITYQLYALFASTDELAQLAADYQKPDFGYGHAKKRLLEKIDAHFGPFREKRRELEANPDFVNDVLATGGRKARDVARATLDAARDACGIPPMAT